MRRFGPYFSVEIMAKPDPIPTFIEIAPKAAASMPTVQAQPVEMDWVDEFLCDREIRPNTQNVYRRQLRGFQVWCAFKHWPEID